MLLITKLLEKRKIFLIIFFHYIRNYSYFCSEFDRVKYTSQIRLSTLFLFKAH